MSDPKDGAIFDFNVKQYEEHRKTLLAVVQEERQMERYVVLACGGFYSWLATQNSGGDVFFRVDQKTGTGYFSAKAMAPRRASVTAG